MKIVLFNVKYSPNLGDGVIAECLEAALRAQTGAEVLSLDLAGRTTYGAARHAARGAAIRLLRHLPLRLGVDGCRDLVRWKVAEPVAGHQLGQHRPAVVLLSGAHEVFRLVGDEGDVAEEPDEPVATDRHGRREVCGG